MPHSRYRFITIALFAGFFTPASIEAQPIRPTLGDKVLLFETKRDRSEDSVDRSGVFDSENVLLQTWMDLGDFGNPSNGNDCWGYTSPSGREYALMGLSNAMAVIEITDPTNPSIIGSISHSSSLWADIKVYQDVAYVSNESGGGIDVVDLA